MTHILILRNNQDAIIGTFTGDNAAELLANISASDYDLTDCYGHSICNEYIYAYGVIINEDGYIMAE